MRAGNHRFLTLIAEYDNRKGWSDGGTFFRKKPRSATAEGAEAAEVENHHADHATEDKQVAQRLRERLFPASSEILSQSRRARR
jgi:hypothetical protein